VQQEERNTVNTMKENNKLRFFELERGLMKKTMEQEGLQSNHPLMESTIDA